MSEQPSERARYEAIALESALLRNAGFRHGFSTRRLDFRPGPARGAALESLSIVLRIDPLAVFQASQVHGARAIVARGDRDATLKEEADALVANVAEVAVGVRVADCVPVLLADPDTGVVAAVHAGWRGIVGGVIEGARAMAKEQGATLSLAAVGPCIESCCFEVGADVANAIAQATSERVVVKRAGDKAMVDLRAAVRDKLVRAGLTDSHIDHVAGCTKCDASRFFSHRREGELAGRHLAVIAARGGQPAR